MSVIDILKEPYYSVYRLSLERGYNGQFLGCNSRGISAIFSGFGENGPYVACIFLWGCISKKASK